MSWFLLTGLVLLLGVAMLATLARRAELARMERRLAERELGLRPGQNTTQLRQPRVDLSRCLGCGTCVTACPEEGVLAVVHGQALVVNGARCVGHAACERECPVGAITVTLANLRERRDVPVLTEELEALDTRGLFLAGEVTAHALIKTAIEQGTRVASQVAKLRAAHPGTNGAALDLCIVGLGPAGLACALEAKRRGLSFVALEQEQDLGGTVAKYPRRKLVLTQPVELPLYGPLDRASYTKEELIDLWKELARAHALPVRVGERFEALTRDAQGDFVVRTSAGQHRAHHVCLALGRRRTPRKLGVPGEQLPKVAYSLLDARSYRDARLLVVGGGDSAVETALALAEQPGNKVTLSYRRADFFRLRARNAERLRQARAAGRLEVLVQSEVRAILPEAVELEIAPEHGKPAGRLQLANDEVFVLAGGEAPFALLERSGVSLDPARRPPMPVPVERGTGLLRALAIAFAFSGLALAWVLLHADYYLLPAEARAADVRHAWLSPGGGLGLAAGFAAAGLLVVNLLYLLRRSGRLRLGGLQAWMTSHVASGILAVLCGLVHASMAPRDTVGGHALLGLVVLLATGALGRYVYALVPRATNGRELALEEIKLRLETIAEAWQGDQRAFARQVRAAVEQGIRARQWKASFLGRLAALVAGERSLRRTLAALGRQGRASGLPAESVAETLELARTAHHTALATAHLEDLRALLNSWRYLHRWVAALLVLLVVLHVVYVVAYGALSWPIRP